MQIGVDIGGTFTDIVALDRDGRLTLTKVPSTPKNLLDGIAAAVQRVLRLAGARPGDVERFIHGTTVATNAILEQPVTLFLSGPAGGVIGAKFAAERSGVSDFVSLDMGGTSNDVAMVRGGEPLITNEGMIGTYPVRTPMVDVSTIGAGGGSIAWIDAAGGLRVGPQSAGAERAGPRVLRARRRR